MRDKRRCNSVSPSAPPPPPPPEWKKARSLEWRHAVTLHILVGRICLTFFLFYCEGLLSLYSSIMTLWEVQLLTRQRTGKVCSMDLVRNSTSINEIWDALEPADSVSKIQLRIRRIQKTFCLIETTTSHPPFGDAPPNLLKISICASYLTSNFCTSFHLHFIPPYS